MSKDLEQPVNVTEKYMYGINIRLNIIIEQLSSLLEHIAKQEGVPVEVTKVEAKEEVITKPERKKRSTSK